MKKEQQIYLIESFTLFEQKKLNKNTTKKKKMEQQIKKYSR